MWATPLEWVRSDLNMLLESCRIVLDRPRGASPDALIYVAESIDAAAPRVIATSSVFHPEIDAAAHRQALADLEAAPRT